MNEDEYKWVTQTAEIMVCEILNQMAHVRAHRLDEPVQDPEAAMDTVYGHVRGDCQMKVWLRAEPATFCRLTENISGESPLGEDIVQEYATEFFNVLCGRFISAICDIDHVCMRFDPPVYRKSVPPPSTEGCDQVHRLYFMSELDEPFEFSWGRHSCETNADCGRSEVL